MLVRLFAKKNMAPNLRASLNRQLEVVKSIIVSSAKYNLFIFCIEPLTLCCICNVDYYFVLT